MESLHSRLVISEVLEFRDIRRGGRAAVTLGPDAEA